MSKLTKILRPSYIKGFKCIGGTCEDSCCIGWNIDIDKLTFRKYFRTDNVLMKQKFKKHVYKNEECDFEEIDYGRMKIPDSKWCPFLDEDKLCEIYSNLGEDHLSNVCHSYPRIYNVLDGVYEISLYMSCPEAVRMLLQNKNPMKFIEEEIKLDKHIVHSYVNTLDKQWKGTPIKELKKLRSMSIKMIQNRSLPLDERLSKLGKKLKSKNITEPLKVENSFTFQLSFFKEAMNTLNVFTEIDSPVFKVYTNNIIKGFNINSSQGWESTSTYQDVMNRVVKPFILKNEYMFEHYLVNSIFQGNFPFNINQDQFDGYLMLVVRYTFIRFYLAGIAIINGEITKEDVVSMIQVHTKTINHHETFISQTLDNIKEREFDNIDFTEIILRV
ncbi:MAG: flagellin lysine-N-methylase [Spirochaetaceae bacterium]